MSKQTGEQVKNDVQVKLWAASSNEEDWSLADFEFKTEEEAVFDALKNDDFKPGRHFWTGWIRRPELAELFPNGREVIDQMVCQAEGIAGEFADDFAKDIDKADRDDLTERMKACLLDWCKAREIRINFFVIEDVKLHVKPLAKK